MNEVIFKQWVDRWNKTINAVEKVSFSPDDYRFELQTTASLSKVKEVENQLGFKIPESLREVLCNFSASIDFFWFLRNFSFPRPLDFITHGICSWDINQLINLEIDRKSWLNFSTEDNKSYEIIRDKFCFLNVGNGDRIAIDLSENSDGKVIYLACHFEDEPGHGYFLGENFIDFIDRWTQIGCVGSEIWQIMEFTNSPTSYINLDSEISVKWREFLRL
jgi:hypothetical protein